tara:strand:+ start:3585 stop:4124 length:540 start_codon:yes stop_codon:yes gene_type:complete
VDKRIFRRPSINFEIKIKDYEPQKIASIRAKTTLDKVPSKVVQLLDETSAYLDSIDVSKTGSPFSIYYEVGSFLVDLEVGYPVSEDIEGNERVKQNLIPGGKCAVAEFIGPHQDIVNAHRAVHAWMHENEIKASGEPAREVFLTDLREIEINGECVAQSVWPVIHESRAEKRRQKRTTQ